MVAGIRAGYRLVWGTPGRRSSMVEQRFCKPPVGGSIPFVGLFGQRASRSRAAGGYLAPSPPASGGSDRSCRDASRSYVSRRESGGVAAPSRGRVQSPPAGFSGCQALVGGCPSWPKGADCKSAGECLHRFESCSPHSVVPEFRLSPRVEARGFRERAHVAQW